MLQRSNKEVGAKYNCKRWRELRKYKLIQTPYCERCFKMGLYTPAYIIHHKEWIDQNNYKDDNVFYNIDNLESICLSCHNKEHFSSVANEEYFFDNQGNLIKK